MSPRFTLRDFIDQMDRVKQLGIDRILKSTTGMHAMMLEANLSVEEIERQINRMRGIFDALSPQEREDRTLLTIARRERVARGAGVAVAEVTAFLKQYEQTRTMLEAAELKLPGITRKMREGNFEAMLANEKTDASMITAIHYATGRPVAIGLSGRKIASIQPADASSEGLPFVAPGLVDLQINGYLGRDFNRVPIPDEALGEAVRLLWKEGVTSFFPTVITNSPEAIEQAMKTIAAACERDPAVNRAVAGVHLEGPFISPEDGARGAHAKQHVRAPDWDLFQRWQVAADGRIKILTMSPEWPNSADFIRKASTAGVTISIGHTAATSEQIREAVAAGARLSTHLGNGAHLMLPRHPNYIWEQLAQDALWTCVIPDGFHLPDQVLKVILKVKGEQAIAVSDAVSLAGMPPGTYDMPVGGKVVLTPAGRLHLEANEKLLAGSAQMLLHGIAHLTKSGLATLGEAWEMSSVRPARLMRMEQMAGLTVGAPADLVLFRKDGERHRVEQTYVTGERVFNGG